MYKLFIALLMIMLIYLQSRLWLGEGSISKIIALRENIEQKQLESDRLALRKQLLVNEIIELQTGLDTIESEARNELGMIKRDETFYLIYD